MAAITEEHERDHLDGRRALGVRLDGWRSLVPRSMAMPALRLAAIGDAATRDGALKAYRNQLDAQIGKTVLQADAARLKAVSFLVR